MDNFHNQTLEEVIERLGVSRENGLDASAAEQRLKEYGENKLQGKKSAGLLQQFLFQFKDFLVLILIAASIISIALGEILDGGVIIAIVLLNAVLGVIQENRAGNALKALKEMSSPQAKALRGGRVEKINSDFVVPGDLILLEAGDYVPADLRLLESVNLKIDEAALTGESVPSEKNAAAVLGPDADLGDRINCAFMGTMVTYGRGLGAVAATGMKTQMGRIAEMLADAKEEATPLQRALNTLGKTLGLVCLGVCAVIFAVGILRNHGMLEMFMTAISLAVAAIPEGLTMVVTVILALGMQKMVRVNAIIKRLSAVETLGSTTVICSDKTGTLTQNKMTVVKLYADKQFYDVTGTGYDAKGEVLPNPGENGAARILAEGAVLCNDAVYQKQEGKIIGDPTEGALIVLGEKMGLPKEDLNRDKPRVRELPFDSDRKLMSTIHSSGQSSDKSFVMYTKGAPDEILRKSNYIYQSNQTVPLTDADRDAVMEANGRFAEDALRVLGVAFRLEKDLPAEDVQADQQEQDLVFAGLLGMIDPPREEAKAAIETCKRAGIQVKMITGDHKTTAMAIARQLMILEDGGSAIDGREIDALNEEELKNAVRQTHVYARVSPEHKARLVTAMRENGHVAAMTGDGVNDAPSLKKADIGIAMGS
ncbi:MAG: HAD-IC family P-type ATPase, partial [Clostridiales bacterium]|nr:HAD-IC family P-type ATPase [Clostridiales bacterium]